MLRSLVLALLAANGLLLAANLGAFDRLLPARQDREPERLQRQVKPEAVGLTPGGLAGRATSATNPAQAAATAPSATPAAALPQVCLQAAPLVEEQANQLAQALLGAGITEDHWQRVALAPAPSFLVAMGPYADRASLQRKQNELRRRKVAWTLLQPGPDLPPDVTPGLGLGRFDDEGAAQAALARLNARGVRTAHVVTLPPSARAGLRVQGSPELRAQVQPLPLPEGAAWEPCAPVAPR